MIDPPEVIAARDLTLQKIGRNVVIFQKMEAMLKVLLTVANYSQPASAVVKHLADRAVKLRSRPMGEVVERTAKVLKSEPEEPPDDLTEPWMSFSIKLEEGTWGVNDWRREMRLVVEERNRLIHHSAAELDPNSIDSCNRLSADLDAQRERVMPAYNRLTTMASGMNAHGKYLRDNIDAIVERLMSSASSHDA